MIIHRMREDECRAVLQRASVGRLGCSFENQPYVVPVFMAYESDYLYVFSTLGQKIEWMRTNPKVCMQVDEIADRGDWVSVIVNGTYQELPDEEDSALLRHARKLLEKDHRWWLNAMAERRSLVEDLEVAPVFFRIHAESMSGLRATDRGQPIAGGWEEAGGAPPQSD